MPSWKKTQIIKLPCSVNAFCEDLEESAMGEPWLLLESWEAKVCWGNAGSWGSRVGGNTSSSLKPESWAGGCSKLELSSAARPTHTPASFPAASVPEKTNGFSIKCSQSTHTWHFVETGGFEPS